MEKHRETVKSFSVFLHNWIVKMPKRKEGILPDKA